MIVIAAAIIRSRPDPRPIVVRAWAIDAWRIRKYIGNESEMASKAYDDVCYWRCHTELGVFYIRQVGGVWHAIEGVTSLGEYPSPTAAHEALIAGKTDRTPAGFSPSQARLPGDLSAWPFYRLERGEVA